MKLIKLLALMTTSTLFVVGCGSTPEKEPMAGDMSTTPVVAPQDSASTQATMEPKVVNVHPLDDPNSLLANRTIYFEFNKSTILDEFQPLIDAHAKFLADNPTAQMKLEGHADERGTREYNIGLGEKRANSLQQLIELKGAASKQVSTISYGEERPVALGHDEESWHLNRRAEIVYLNR